jgi:hypothetical protein
MFEYALGIEYWERLLKVKVSYTTEELNERFKATLPLICKSLIPKAQTYYLLSNDILEALPETYKHAFSFEHKGEKYDFSYRRFNMNLLIQFELDHFDKDRTGTAIINYNPTVEISKNGQVVFNPRINISSKNYII